jgi:hypothetical protein
MRKLIKATVLTLALTIPAWAGDIGNPVPLPTQGRQATESTEPTNAGDMGAPITATDLGLSVLQSLLALV